MSSILTAQERLGDPSRYQARLLRGAGRGWAFNPATRDQVPPPETAAALDWAERASLPVAELEDTAVVRRALGACARTEDGVSAMMPSYTTAQVRRAGTAHEGGRGPRPPRTPPRRS